MFEVPQKDLAGSTNYEIALCTRTGNMFSYNSMKQIKMIQKDEVLPNLILYNDITEDKNYNSIECQKVNQIFIDYKAILSMEFS